MPDEDLENKIGNPEEDQSEEDEPADETRTKKARRNPDLRLHYNPHDKTYKWRYKDPRRQFEADRLMDEFWAEVRKRDPGSKQNLPINPLPSYDPRTGPKPMSLIQLLRLNRSENPLIIPNKSATDPIYAGDILASIVLGLEPKYGTKLAPVRYQLTDKSDGMLELSIYHQNSDLHAQISYTFDKRLAGNTFTHDPDGPVFVTHLREDLKPSSIGNPISRQTHIESLQVRHLTMLYFLSKLEAIILDGTTPKRTLHATYIASMTARAKNNGGQELGRRILAFPLNTNDGTQIYRILPSKALAKKSIQNQLTPIESKQIEQMGQDFDDAIKAHHAPLNYFFEMYRRKIP